MNFRVFRTFLLALALVSSTTLLGTKSDSEDETDKESIDSEFYVKAFLEAASGGFGIPVIYMLCDKQISVQKALELARQHGLTELAEFLSQLGNQPMPSAEQLFRQFNVNTTGLSDDENDNIGHIGSSLNKDIIKE